jgi:hypothetical protein
MIECEHPVSYICFLKEFYVKHSWTDTLKLIGSRSCSFLEVLGSENIRNEPDPDPHPYNVGNSFNFQVVVSLSRTR